MALLRECLFALRARQRKAESRDNKPPVEAQRAHPPHRAEVAGQTASHADRSSRRLAEQQAAPRRGDG